MAFVAQNVHIYYIYIFVVWKTIYLSAVTVSGLSAFILTHVTGESNKFRRLRGISYIIVGLQAGVPGFHSLLTTFFSSFLK